jgi:segregation and condensation protein A
VTVQTEYLASENTAVSRGYKVKLEIFEGPLDLLLYLIKKEEIDIYDIPVARITEQYLEYIKVMQELDINIAGEFLLMAAQLIHIKSKMLLPEDPNEDPDSDELEDPRKELVHRLLEHQRYRAAAEELWVKAGVEQAVFTRAPLDTDKENPEISATVVDLIEVFKKVMERARQQMELEIEREQLTMVQMIEDLKKLLAERGEFSVNELLYAAKSRQELITIFLTILELAKEYVIRLIQERTLGEIRAVKY